MIDYKHTGGSPNNWILSFDAQGDGLFLTDDIDRVWANRYSADSGWGNPELIDDMATPAEDASYGDTKDRIQLFHQENGNALAVWHQYHGHGSPHQTWSNRYTVGRGWGKAEVYIHDHDEDSSPEIFGDARGTVFAVWTHKNNKADNKQLLARGYHPDTGWGKTAVIAESTGTPKIVLFKVDVLGNAYALWVDDKTMQNDKDKHKHKQILDILIRRYTPTAGWGRATLVVHEPVGGINLEMAFDRRGNALLAWTQHVAGGVGVWAKRYLADRGWDEVVRIDPEVKRGDARDPVIDFDEQGNAMLMWWQNVGDIFASRYSVAEGWSPAAQISSQTRSAYKPRFVFDKNGNALAVWSQHDGRRDAEIIMSGRYTAGIGWSTPVLLSGENKESRSDPRIAVDAEGNAIAVWWQRGWSGSSILYNQYDVIKGWAKPKLLQADSTSTATRPEVAFDAKGVAHVSWTRMPSENESYRVWTSRLLLAQLYKQQTSLIPPRTVRSPVMESQQ